jgi:hypothetical protein
MRQMLTQVAFVATNSRCVLYFSFLTYVVTQATRILRVRAKLATMSFDNLHCYIIIAFSICIIHYVYNGNTTQTNIRSSFNTGVDDRMLSNLNSTVKREPLSTNANSTHCTGGDTFEVGDPNSPESGRLLNA